MEAFPSMPPFKGLTCIWQATIPRIMRALAFLPCWQLPEAVKDKQAELVWPNSWQDQYMEAQGSNNMVKANGRCCESVEALACRLRHRLLKAWAGKENGTGL